MNSHLATEEEATNFLALAEYLTHSSVQWIELAYKGLNEGRASPRIVLFADLVGSTKAAKESATNAFVLTLTHHLVTYAIIKYALGQEQLSLHIIKTVGDEIIISLETNPTTTDEKQRAELLLNGAEMLLYSALIARKQLKLVGIETKMGIHWCREYIPASLIISRVELSEDLMRRIPHYELNVEALFTDKDLVGHDMNLAARIAHSVQANQVIVSEILFKELFRAKNPDAEVPLNRRNIGSLTFSERLYFQHWKGIVDPEQLIKGLTSEGEDMRSARLVALSEDVPPPSSQGLLDPISYRWPFQALTLFSGNPCEQGIFTHPELGNNIIFGGAVTKETHLFYDGLEVSNAEVKEEEKRWSAFARMCAYDFSLYTWLIHRFVLEETANNVLSYSYPIQLRWAENPTHPSHEKFQTRMSRLSLKSRDVQTEPTIEGCICMLVTRTFDLADQISRRFNRLNSCIEAAPLFGEWDLYAILQGANALDQAMELIAKMKKSLRPGVGVESGLLLEFRVGSDR